MSAKTPDAVSSRRILSIWLPAMAMDRWRTAGGDDRRALDSRPQDTEILRIDARDIYIAAYRQPNGRYTEHVEEVLKPLYKQLGKGVLDTMRNWNTIEKFLS